jgi:hypothetical protein
VAKQRINSDLIADLTWAELYTARIRESLKILTPVVKKTATKDEFTEGVARLRQQLESANRTAADLRKMLRVEPRRRSSRNPLGGTRQE